MHAASFKPAGPSIKPRLTTYLENTGNAVACWSIDISWQKMVKA